MKISCVINSVPRTFDADPSMKLRELLVQAGHVCVRDSDDSEGFCGSDTILMDGKPVYSNLCIAAEADGTEIVTPDALGSSMKLSAVQQAMVDAGVVQSAYNAPAAALLLTWLLDRVPDPTREQIRDVLSGVYIRDAGYEAYYLAVQLAHYSPLLPSGISFYRKTGGKSGRAPAGGGRKGLCGGFSFF